jgi:hypothetical protein
MRTIGDDGHYPESDYDGYGCGEYDYSNHYPITTITMNVKMSTGIV